MGGDRTAVAGIEEWPGLPGRPVVDRQAVAEQIETLLRDASPSDGDVGRSEDEILRDVINEVARTRAERRKAISG